jgi:hypothetical protein
MPTIRRTFNGHDFTYGSCVCGLTREHYDDIGQPLCAGPRTAASMGRTTNEQLVGEAVPSARWRGRPVGRVSIV